ncbi:MAG TPA: 3-isopropylmalate dehydratase small subunit [Burkholderiales bacterium]|nr:3-isopropylmalate dehydratase small subunit [Burkholderiales bacterium]
MPEPFQRLTAVAVPLDDANIDTGRIFPSRFLRKPRSAGYHNFLFRDARFDPDGNERPDFILNRAPYRAARIAVTGPNFACGSSRESAVYAFVDAGFRCIVAASFGEIFFSNCFRNGLLPVVLPAQDVIALRQQLHERPGAGMTVDLEAQTVCGPDGRELHFDIDSARMLRLVKGLDDAALALEYVAQIEAFETRHFKCWPWAAAR